MKVAYIPHPSSFEPRYSDFVSALDVEVDVVLADDPSVYVQAVADAAVVVEDGGLIGDAAAIRAAAAGATKVWQVTTTGVDHVDVDLFRELGLPLAHVPSYFTAPAVAEHTLFLMLALARSYRRAAANFASRTFYEPSGVELSGKSVGLVGFGATGREVALRATALGMNVIAVEADPAQIEEGERVTGIVASSTEQLPQLLAQADFVSIHVPLMDSTRHLIGAEELAAMQPHAYLINTARGAVVDEGALHRALTRGEIAGAGLDVFSVSPVDPDEPLLQLENVIATPHVAGITRESSRRHGAVAAENVARVHAGEPPTHLVRR